jgi:hypothetical protein
VRGCASVLILAAAFVVAGAWFGGPLLAETLVGGALGAAGFEAREQTIDATADPPIEVLAGTVDRVDIDARDARFGDLEAERMAVALFGVDLVTRTFATIEGDLTDVTLRTPDGGASTASRVELIGEPENVRATVHLSPQLVSDLVARALERQLGFSVGETTLEAPDQVAFTAGPARVTARFLIEADGGLWLAVDAPGNPRVQLLAAGDPLTFREVTVGEEVILVGTLDLARELR